MTYAATTHGMDGTLVSPDWPPLKLEEVRAVLAQFAAIGAAERILTVSPRPFSAAGVVQAASGPVFVKRHDRRVRDREGLLGEHRFLAHLFAKGAPVPRVHVSDEGESAIALGEATYEVHAIPAGVDAYEDAISWTPFRAVGHAHAAGEALARLHIASRGYEARARRPRPLVASFSIFAARDPIAAMARYLGQRPCLGADRGVRVCAARALDLLTPFHAELAPLLPGLEPLWTHNDLHNSNLFWSDGSAEARATGVIDFGLSDRTNAVHDLAHAIERNIVEWLDLVNDPGHPCATRIHLDHLEALLDGYESVRPLSAEEREALAPMTALCHAEFALSEADYFLDVLQAEEKAVMAYEGWLVGHAEWFHCETGRALLDALRRRAAGRRTRGAGRG